MQKDNFSEVVKQFVKQLAIPVTKQTIEKELSIHPEYNSFIAISDVLNTWNVPNAAYQLTFDELLGAEIEDPFIAFISNGRFVLVSRLHKHGVIVSNEKWKKRKLTIKQFEEVYSGSILVAEKDAASGESEYEEWKRKAFYDDVLAPAIALGGAAILLAFFINASGFLASYSLYNSLAALIKTLGITASGLLLIQTFNPNNPVLQKLCGSRYHIDCKAVFSSKAARLFDVVWWSEIGLFYFAGTWIALLFNSNDTALIQMLGILNFFTLPYTFYAIYYQWKVVKEWCIACCIVQILLWLEFLVFLPLVANGLTAPGLTSVVHLALALLIPITLWLLVKTFFFGGKKEESFLNDLSFKFNRDVFESSISSSAKYALPNDNDVIIMGNPQAETTITLVVQPYGKLNTEDYRGIAWMKNRDDIKIQLVFAGSNDPNDPNGRVITHLFSFKARTNNASSIKAIDDWYAQNRKRFDDWTDRYPIYKNDKGKEILNKQKEWCQMADVKKIPAIFINGKQLTLSYKTCDLKYFL